MDGDAVTVAAVRPKRRRLVHACGVLFGPRGPATPSFLEVPAPVAAQGIPVVDGVADKGFDRVDGLRDLLARVTTELVMAS